MDHQTQPADLAAPSPNRHIRRTQEALSRRAKSTAALYDFAVPPWMVELEFESIWRQHQAQQEMQAKIAAARRAVATAEESNNRVEAPAEEVSNATASLPAEAAGPEASPTEEPDGATAPDEDDVTEAGATVGQDQANQAEEALKAAYRKVAERRVRLGLLLTEVRRNNNITVTREEVNQAITREARQRPGYEREVLDLYRQTPSAIRVTPARLAYTINNACIALDLGRSTLYQLIGAGPIRTIKVGRRTLITAQELLRFLDSCDQG
jgi:excisionase family DNA binding protein